MEIITLCAGCSSKEWENGLNSLLRLNSIQLTYLISFADALTMKVYARCSPLALVNTLSYEACKTDQDSGGKCKTHYDYTVS